MKYPIKYLSARGTPLFDAKYLRDETDQLIWRRTYVENEYQVPGNMDGKMVLDVGGHVGAFALKVVKMGASVISIEPYQDSQAVYKINLKDYPDKYRLLPYAIGRKKGITDLYLGKDTSSFSTCYNNNKDSISVPTISFKSILGAPFDYVKIDAEGIEWAILQDAVFPKSVKELVVEFHRVAENADLAEVIHDNLTWQGFTLESHFHRRNDPNFVTIWRREI